MRGPSDRLGAEVARGILEDGDLRRHLTADIFVPSAQEDGLGRLEATLKKVVSARPIKAKLRDAARKGANGSLEDAVAGGVITCEERQRLLDADAARNEAIQVDAFDPESYRNLRG